MNNTTSDNTQEQSSMIADIKKILSDFNTKLILILVSLFVLCNAFIMGVIDKYIANGILSGFDDNIAERILFISVGIVLIYYTVIDIWNNKKVSSSRFGWAFTFLLFWAYYRLLSDEWIYVKFWDLKYLSYIDIVPLYSLSIIIKTVRCKRVTREIDASKGFEADLPIKEEKSDSLIKRDKFAEELAIKIKNTPIEECAFSIGIESPWGAGKTSFINLLCKHVEDKDTVIIKFNPWNYEKERNLVDAFFLELRENLKKYDSSLSTNLTEYARILSDSNHDIIKFGAKFVECFSSQSVEAKRKVINSAIKGIGKLILVVIDDLDRLDKDEIMSVLKLIRNSANFPNMVFVSAYDRDYLIETLKNDVCKSNKYLEKIFQYQFKLPEYDKSKLKEVLYEEGLKIIKPEDKDEFNKAIFNSVLLDTHTGFMIDYVENVRDVYRFLNAFNLVYQRLHGEVVVTDLMNIELLRMKYNYVYELLSKDHEKYLVSPNDNLILWNDSIKELNTSFFEYKDILKNIGNKYNEDGKDFMQITSILKSMFGKRYTPQIPKTINNPSYINRYFYYSLLDSDISAEEFDAVMKKKYDEIKLYIKDWVDKNKSISLTRHIIEYIYNGSHGNEKIIKSIFYFGYLDQKWSVGIPYIIDCVNYFAVDNKEKKAFLRGVFFENGVSEFVAQFIYDIFENSIDDFVFTVSEYNEMSLNMLKMVCEEENDINTIYKFWSYTCFFRIDNNRRVKVINKEAYSFLINYIKTNYNTVLPQLIDKNSNNCAYISNPIVNLWKDRQALISFINDILVAHEKDKLLKEFSEFMNKFYDQEKLNPIQFDFKYI